MSLNHQLSTQNFLIRYSGRSIEQKPSVKVLGVTFDQHLSWDEQVNNIVKAIHGTLRSLRKFSRFTPTNVRKTLAETLILSKMNYCNVVFGQITDFNVCKIQQQDMFMDVIQQLKTLLI